MRLLHAIYPIIVLSCCAQVHADIINFDSLIKGVKDPFTSAKALADNAFADLLAAGSDLIDPEHKASEFWNDAQRTVRDVQQWYARALDAVSAAAPAGPAKVGAEESKSAGPVLMAQFVRELKGVHDELQKTLALPSTAEQDNWSGAKEEEEEESGAGGSTGKDWKAGKGESDTGKDKKKKPKTEQWKKKLYADVSLILDAVEDGIVRVFAIWNVPEENVRRDFGAIKPHIHRVLVLAGELAHRHPWLFKRTLSVLLRLIMPGISPALALVFFDIFAMLFSDPPEFEFPGN